MTSRTKIFLSSTQILVSFFFIVVAVAILQNGTFLNNIYQGKQSASVASSISATADGCYLQSDIDDVQSEGNTLLMQVNSYNTQLETLEVEIRDTVFQMKENERVIEELKTSLMSEETIQKQNLFIQNLQTEASKLRTILTLASSTASTKTLMLGRGQVLTTLNGKIYPLKTYKLGELKNQLRIRDSVDSKYKMYTDWQKKTVLAQAKYSASVVIDKKSTEVVVAENAMKFADGKRAAAPASTRDAAQAEYDKRVATYNTLNMQLTNLNKEFDTKYGKVAVNISGRILDAKTKVLRRELDAAKDDEAKMKGGYQSAESLYAKRYDNDKRTVVELGADILAMEASIASMEAEYKGVKVEFDEITKEYAQQTADLKRLKNEFNQMYYADIASTPSIQDIETKNIYDNQGDYDANLLSVEDKIKVAQSFHDTYMAAHTKALEDIQIFTDNNVSLFEKLKVQTSKKADLKAERVGVQDLVDTLTQRLETYAAQVCPVILLEPPVILPDIDTTERVTVESISIPPAYSTALTAIMSSAQNVEDTNNSTVLPRMQALRTKSESGNYDGIMELINSAKSAVTENQQDLLIFTSAIQKLTTEISAQVDHQGLKDATAVFVAKANTLKSAYTAYFTTFLGFLTGEVPPPSLETELSTRISQLTSASVEFDSQTTSLNAYIKDLKSQKSMPLASLGVSPSPTDIAVPKDTRTISVSFDKSIQEYRGGSIILRSAAGNPLNISSVQLDDTQRTIVIRLGMNDSFEYNTAYLVSVDLTFTVEDRSLKWSKDWGFVTAGKPVDGKGKNNTDDESPKETSCIDEVDNDENGLTDCQDLECAYTEICKDPVCGNEKIEKGEQCDDGNQVDNDGCSAMCEIEYRCGDQDGNGIDDSMSGETCGCPDVDGDGYNDETKLKCPVQKERGNKTCLVCYYGEDSDAKSEGENRFKISCEDPNIKADKRVIIPLLSKTVNFSVSRDCPLIEYRHFKEYLISHAQCSDYRNINLAVRGTISGIVSNYSATDFNNYTSIPEEDRFTTVDSIDDSCSSGGGEYVKNGIAEIDHIETMREVRQLGFIGTYTQTVSQIPVEGIRKDSFGLLYKSPESPAVGRFTLSSVINKSKYTGISSVSFNECPKERDYCYVDINQSAIRCGNGERYYCDYELISKQRGEGVWRRDARY